MKTPPNWRMKSSKYIDTAKFCNNLVYQSNVASNGCDDDIDFGSSCTATVFGFQQFVERRFMNVRNRP